VAIAGRSAPGQKMNPLRQLPPACAWNLASDRSIPSDTTQSTTSRESIDCDFQCKVQLFRRSAFHQPAGISLQDVAVGNRVARRCVQAQEVLGHTGELLCAVATDLIETWQRTV